MLYNPWVMGHQSVIQLMGHGAQKCRTTHGSWVTKVLYDIVWPMDHGKKVTEGAPYIHTHTCVVQHHASTRHHGNAVENQYKSTFFVPFLVGPSQNLH